MTNERFSEQRETAKLVNKKKKSEREREREREKEKERNRENWKK